MRPSEKFEANAAAPSTDFFIKVHRGIRFFLFNIFAPSFKLTMVREQENRKKSMADIVTDGKL